MTAPANTEALYALFADWYQQQLSDEPPQSTEVVEITLPRSAGAGAGAGARSDNRRSVNLEDLSASAQRAYEQRRVRDRVFQEPELFGEPVWDMLLDIAVAEERGACLSVTSVCIGSCVAETTALRWLKMMEVRGLTCREADPRDGRRSFIRLTEDGHEKLKRYFEEVEGL